VFTGIIEEVGSVVSVRHGQASSVLTLTGYRVFDDLKQGDSIAVDGVCLTVAALNARSFSADVMPETLRHSTLGSFAPKRKVNLERALPAAGRFGGHIVSGHIDGVGTIQNVTKDDNALVFTVRAEQDILRGIVPQGSIAVDGISLTVAELTKTGFRVSIIPHTAQMTTLSLKKAGDAVNLETDVVGKYVDKILSRDGTVAPEGFAVEQGKGQITKQADAQAYTGNSSITAEFLARNGF